MPKVKIVCLILATVLASVGTILVITNLSGGEILPLDAPETDLNTYLDRPIDGTPADVEDVRENLFIAHKTLLMRKGFYGVSNGATTSFGINQQVSNIRYVVGEFGHKNSFKQMVTKGVVPNAYQLYMWDDNYLHRDFNKVNSISDVSWKDTATKLNESDFYTKFGHRSDKLTAYILNYDTVLSGKLEKVEDGMYTFRFVLDTEEAPLYLRQEMVTNGNLNGYPTFAKAEIVVTMDAEWNITTLRTDSEYTAQTMGINARCTEDITETFYDFDGDLPEKDFFEQFFDADYSDVAQEKGALDVLLEMFSPYLNGEDLQVSLAVNKGNTNFVSGLVSVSGLDISDLSKLSVNAKIGNALNVAYEHGESKIYLKYQDFQASTTVDGIMGLVDTIAPLLGDDVSLGDTFSDIDLDGLLDNLTYEITDDGKCIVSLPLSLAGLDIDAKLYADVDGDTYTFTNAVIAIGEIEIVIEPHAWSVEERTGAYPEILGLADLVQNGKIALNAQLALALNGITYDVDAEALIDLATMSVALNAELGNNGSLSAVFVDSVLYVEFGEIKLKLNVADVDSLIELIEQYLGVSLEMELPEVSVNDILGLLSTITATNVTNGGVVLNVSVGSVDCNVYLVAQDDRWQLDSITIDLDGVNATIAHSSNYGDVVAPSDPDSYVDVTELAETFIDPIVRIINGDSFGADFTLNLAVGAKTYLIKGSVAFDANKTLSVTATVYDGNVGIVDANVVYANDTVYLTVNGIKVAFAVGGGSSTDVNFSEAISQLLENEQIAALLSSHEGLSALVDKIGEIVEVVSNFELSQLLNIDFTDVIYGFAFNNGELSLSLDGSALGLDGIAVDVTVANDDGRLAVSIGGLQLANISLALSATVTTEVETIAIPDADDYILNLYGSVNIDGVAIVLEVSADLINLDIWATVQINNEVIDLRYVGGVVYVLYGNAAIKLDTTDLDSIMDMIGELIGTDAPSFGDFDIASILSALSFNLTDLAPNISLAINGIEVSVNFNNIDGLLRFDNISVNVSNGKINATLELNGQQAKQLDISGEFVDVNELTRTFADSIVELVNAQDFAFSIIGDVSIGSNTYTINVDVSMSDGNTHIKFRLLLGNVNVLNGRLWIVDNVLYLEVGDLHFTMALNEKSDSDTKLTLEDIKETLAQLTGYNTHLDDLIELALNVLDTPLENIQFAELLFKLAFTDGNLKLGVNGEMFGLSQFELTLGATNNGVNFALSNLAYKDIAVNLSGTISSYTGEILAPNGDFTTNLNVIIDENNTLHANIDLINNVIKLQLESRASNGKVTKLDILYTLSDNIIKITNGQNLYISADINNIVDIIKEIDKIVNEFAGTDASGAMSGLATLSNVDLKSILKSLRITTKGNKAELSLTALGFDITATFAGGELSSIVVPVADGLTLTVMASPMKADYADFPENAKYVRIDDVFNDYFYGDGEGERGAIDTLIHTNSWKFDFMGDSEITVTNDDGTVDKYQIAANSYFVFYFNKSEAENFSLRAKLTINKWNADKWKEFIILDIAYFDGRIYVCYDSNSSNKNVLKATVSVEAIKECLNLLPSLYKVVPQLEDLINNLKETMSSAQGSITLGNLASLFNEVTYNEDKVFTLSLNAGIIDGLGEIYLSAQQFGNQGLQLNQLNLSYSNISVNINNIVVTASPSTENADGSKSFDYVNEYILSYLNENGGFDSFMNLDSIRELLAGFVITADNVDEYGNRSFAIEGTIHANMIGLAKVDIQIYINVDIDKDNNVYLAVKIHRESATGLAGGLAYDDEGGDSYLLLNSLTQTVTLARNSIQKQTWCSKCGWSCSNTILHAIYRSNKKVSDYEYRGEMSYLVQDLPLADFVADTATMVDYILELVNFSSTIEKPIKNAIGSENTNEYGIEDILKSYSYSYDEAISQGTFALVADLSPIDSALGDLTVNIVHVGNFDDVYYDEDGNFHDGGGSVALTQINGTATMISVMNATFELNLVEATTGLAYNYVTTNYYLW